MTQPLLVKTGLEHHVDKREAALTRAESQLALRAVEHALEAFDAAEQLGADPDQCAGGRWFCHMLLGDFQSAWRESDAIRQRGTPDPARVWNGEPVHGRRVLIRSVHGFGDAVQFLRYAPLLRAMATHVAVQVAPALAELARGVAGIDQVLVWEEETAFDRQLEITELPYLFRSTADTLPSAFPYLQVSASQRAAARRVVPPSHRVRVGVVWTGGTWDSTRSLPLSVMEPILLHFPQVEFWSLQQPADNADWFVLCERMAWGNRAIDAASIAELASYAAEMDLVLTIDSLAAHLAGALARPVWVLLKQEADWRWMLDRSDSPWYPTMRLFRQPSAGDWAGALEAVGTALSRWLEDSRPRSTTPGL
ncbi:ADP-heptose--LPS heptosyltransferase [Acidipila sp. EB88]|uniref:ADP-heptose--LPS heptosyltransferase n=1 Tax=Acidipila sp. EB88 TaxID=2305226 RepID=UPI000F5F1FC8|nr:ADP-heptose--LPS heptosyltransferase [Acidipila sp. EB88]RRA49391.1 ADP-heptose--LPS heptosyltransferase [Acidipila sp. EB88]